MVGELVTFRHPDGTTREQALQGALAVAPLWQANPRLIRKHFLLGEDGAGAGFYIWPTREDAQAAHNPDWIARKEAETGATVSIQYFDLMLIVDNETGEVVQPE